MVEEIIVYRRRPTQAIKHHSSLKRKPDKSYECSTKTDSSQEFHTQISDPMQKQGRAKRIKCIFSPRKENSLEKLASDKDNTSFKSTEFDSSEFSGGNSKRKPRIKTHNNDQKKVVAYFDLETELVDVDLDVEVSNRAEKVPFVRLTSELYGKPISGYPLEIGEVVQSELVDVNLKVELSNRAEKVPFVRLMSELYGKPILGYPLEIGEITTDGSETNVARGVSGGKRSRMHQLVWRTSKRTPVCYIQATKASDNGEENGVLPKNSKQVNGGKTAQSQTCVPVEVIFSKISSGTNLS